MCVCVCACLDCDYRSDVDGMRSVSGRSLMRG